MNVTDIREYEANMFAANFLIEDTAAMEALHDCNGDTNRLASELEMPAPFLMFKLSSMVQRGVLKGNLPTGLDSRILGKALS